LRNLTSYRWQVSETLNIRQALRINTCLSLTTRWAVSLRRDGSNTFFKSFRHYFSLEFFVRVHLLQPCVLCPQTPSFASCLMRTFREFLHVTYKDSRYSFRACATDLVAKLQLPYSWALGISGFLWIVASPFVESHVGWEFYFFLRLISGGNI